MVLTPRLDQRQSQSLVMTPQLQQAIKLLQLSNIELIEFVDKEIEANPMLEREEVTNEERFEASEEEINGLPDIDFDLPESAEIPVAKELDVEIDNVYTNDSETDVLNNNAPQNMSPHKNNFESHIQNMLQIAPNLLRPDPVLCPYEASLFLPSIHQDFLYLAVRRNWF